MKLFISPSSQDANKGLSGAYVEEVQMNKIADILIPELIRHGIVVGRNSKTGDYNTHVADSNSFKPDYHIAIHSNATGKPTNTTIRGCEMFCHKPLEPLNKGTQMATAIYNEVVAIMTVKGRGIKDGTATMSEIKYTTAPACLIEIDYHDNDNGAKWIMANIAQIAQAILMGMLKQCKVAYIPKPVADNGGGNIVVDYKTWQTFLNAKGKKLAVDNSFGPATTKATNEYKASVGLPQDGKLDLSTTLKALSETLATAQSQGVTIKNRDATIKQLQADKLVLTNENIKLRESAAVQEAEIKRLTDLIAADMKADTVAATANNTWIQRLHDFINKK